MTDLQNAIKGVCEMPASTAYLPFEPTVELLKRAYNEIEQLRKAVVIGESGYQYISTHDEIIKQARTVATVKSKPPSARHWRNRMSDLVERLRAWADAAVIRRPDHDNDMREAADEIERLRDELAEFHELQKYAKSLNQETYLELHAKNERLRSALEEIFQLDHDLYGQPNKYAVIARKALTPNCGEVAATTIIPAMIERAARAMWDSEPVIYSWGPQERHHLAWEDAVSRELIGVKIFHAFAEAALRAALEGE